MKNQKAFLDFAKDVLTEYFSAATFPVLILMGGWFWSRSELSLFSLVLIVIFLLIGILVGWRLHFQKTMKVRCSYLGKYDSNLDFLENSTRVDMIAITFAGLFNFEKHIKTAIRQNGSTVRILMLDVESEAFNQYSNKAKESKLEALIEERNDAVQIILEIQQDMQNAKLASSSMEKGRISYEFFDSFPFRGCIVSDEIIRYWPYLEHLHPSSSPTYEIARNGQIGEILTAEFEYIWNESVSQRSRKRWLVERVISGGQTGADRAALDWAIQHNIDHSGWCPKGRLAEDGGIDSKYNLRETSSSAYEERTELNVRDSDATAIFTISPQLVGGSLWTLSCAKKHKKPWIQLVGLRDGSQAFVQLLEFLQKHDVRLLNIAGSRESEESEVGNFVFSTLRKAYQDLTS